MDRIVVMGKSVPTQVYELLGKKGAVTPRRIEIACRYEEALFLHWDRQWDEALARLQDVLAAWPEDVASQRLRARIEGYKANPPPAAWTGEFVRATKD